MKSAIYARVSTNRQESLNQLAELREYVARQGWETYREYVDEDVPGKAPKPELENLLLDAHQRRFEIVVFWALDRLTRKGAKDALDILARLGAAHVDFVSFREPYLSSLGPWRDAIVGVIATVANVETARAAERIRAGLARVRAEGRHLGRPTRAYPVESEAIAQGRAQGRSWGAMAREYGIPRTSLRRLYQKALTRNGASPPVGTEAE